MKKTFSIFIVFTLAISGLAQPFARNISPISSASTWFVDANTGYTVGSRGKILKTTDGGHHWEHYYTGIEENFSCVKFYNSSLGVVLGGNETILITHNGGGTWELVTGDLNLPFSGNFSDIWFHDADHWSITSYNAILKTDDGGVTWYYILTNSNNNVRKIVFKDASNGFLTTNGAYTIYKTTDGGATWNFSSAFSMDTPANDFIFVDVNTGLLALSGGDIVRTADGGNSWTAVYNGSIPLFGFVFTDAQNGYCVGDDGTILRTTDGGANWSDISLTGISLSLTGGRSTSSETLFMGESGMRVRGTGDTFTIESEWSVGHGTLFALGFYDENNGIVGGSVSDFSEGIALRTNDGGNSWKRISLPSIADIFDVHYVSATDVYLLGQNTGFGTIPTIFHSTDGGLNFSEYTVNTNNGVANINWTKMKSIGNNYFLAGNGIEGGFFYSTDAGVSWTKSSDPIAWGTDFDMFDASNGFLSGYTGSGIPQTNDGGVSFTVSPLSTPQGLYCVDYGNASTIFAGGDWGNIFKSSNNGASWSSVHTEDFHTTFRNIEFWNENKGIAVGGKMDESFNNPYLYYTNDGGASFQQIDAARDFAWGSNTLYTIKWVGEDLGYAAGEASNLYKICNTCNNPETTVNVTEWSESTPALVLFPNPAKPGSLVRIGIDERTKASYRLMNISGQVISTGNVRNQAVSLPAGIVSGIYILSVQTETGIYNTRITVEE
ncbi:MAG: T9SS type A sorting domain-containing protein [Crocinitomicaceae bacterium]|nr:T9SS type A sorting domain-containing protein [Crocinitomicaceae bacterium]